MIGPIEDARAFGTIKGIYLVKIPREESEDEHEYIDELWTSYVHDDYLIYFVPSDEYTLKPIEGLYMRLF